MWSYSHARQLNSSCNYSRHPNLSGIHFLRITLPPSASSPGCVRTYLGWFRAVNLTILGQFSTNIDQMIIKYRKQENRLKKYFCTKFRNSHQKFFYNNWNSVKRLSSFPICDYDTGVFLTCNQLFKMFEKIRGSCNHLVNKYRAILSFMSDRVLWVYGYHNTQWNWAFWHCVLWLWVLYTDTSKKMLHSCSICSKFVPSLHFVDESRIPWDFVAFIWNAIVQPIYQIYLWAKLFCKSCNLPQKFLKSIPDWKIVV